MPQKGSQVGLPQVIQISKQYMCYALCLDCKVSFACTQAPWGIISVKAQDEDYETPMQPVTIMRNSLVRVAFDGSTNFSQKLLLESASDASAQCCLA